MPPRAGSCGIEIRMSFRADINGLRALAVLSVLFYHFSIPGFGGGYVGVDVFFVISGFLMTQIIHTKLSAERFTLTGFYAARVRRILPALLGLVIIMLACGFFYLIPSDYELLGRHAFRSLLFTSNINFAHKGGYFDTTASEEWLLHTWSLSVEGQFYLLFPFFLLGLMKLGSGRFLKTGVITLFALSLLLSTVETRYDQTSAFYLLPTRIWEFLAGAMTYFFKWPSFPKRHLEKAGIALILSAVFFYSGELEYPGYLALLPVLGAAAVISSRSNNLLLTNKAAQFFGNISYSLYLWHWPVILAAKYFDVNLSPLHIVSLLAVSMLLGTLSYIWIETPFRHAKKETSDKKSLAVCVGGCLSVALAAYLVSSFDGIPLRVPDNVREVVLEKKDINPRRSACLFDGKKNLPECSLGTKAAPSVVLWGDSHADAVFTTFNESLIAANRSGIFYSYSGCPSVLGALYSRNTKRWNKNWTRDQCKNFNQKVFDKILSDPQIHDVFMVSRWSGYLQDGNKNNGSPIYVVFNNGEKADASNLQERTQQYTKNILGTMCSLREHGKNVYVVAPTPEMDRNVPEALAKSRLLEHQDITIDVPLSGYEEQNAPVLQALKQAKMQCGVHILDIKPYLCDKNKCPGIRNGRSLYRDTHHLNEYGSHFLEPMFSKVLAD